MKTLIKINRAIEEIKKSSLKKQGKNKFSNYDYYTPEQVAELVTGATHKFGLLAKFDLVRNDLGITGKLSIYDTESDEQPIVYEMASAIPEIKATNIAQQLGGAMTYTKRYLLMNAFDIVDNNLDFDTTENTQKQAEKQKQNDVSELDESAKIGLNRVISGCKTIESLESLWKNNKELQSEKWFISAITTRKKILVDNGINE